MYEDLYTQENSPLGEAIARAYTVGELAGWNESAARDAFTLLGNETNSFGSPVFKPLSLDGRAWAGKKTMLYLACRQVLGSDTPNYPQQIGDCVSFGGKNAAEYLTCLDILMRGVREKWRPVFPPYYYGTSRVQIGGQHDMEDGSTGAWLAAAVIKYGTLFADEQGVPAYGKDVAKKWGYSGPPEEFIPLGQKHLVHSAALISSWDDLVAAIANGYPCTTASNIGYEMKAGSDGFHHQAGAWGHQMCATSDVLIKGRTPKRIDAILVGDRVLAHDGKLHRVSKTFTRPFKGLVTTLRVYGHPALRVTPNHPVLVSRPAGKVAQYTALDCMMHEHGNAVGTRVKGGRRTLHWVNAEDVNPGDFLVTPALKPHSGPTEVPMPLVCDDDVAWLLGLHLADGHAEPNHRISITFAGHETDLAERCVKAFGKLGLIPRLKSCGTYIRVKAYSASLANSFLEWFGSKQNKHMPEWLWTWPNLDAFLAGMWDGDGGFVHRSSRKRIVNTSRVLIDQLHTLLVMSGKTPFVNYHDYEDHPTWSRRYTLEWNDGTRTKKTHNFRCGNYLCLRVREVGSAPYDGLVYNLEVEDAHSYVAEGVVVHNCFIGVGFSPEPYAIILNNWGADVHGQLQDFDDQSNLPGGVLRVRQRDAQAHIAAGETFAWSQFDGFPEQDINRELFKLVGS